MPDTFVQTVTGIFIDDLADGAGHTFFMRAVRPDLGPAATYGLFLCKQSNAAESQVNEIKGLPGGY